MQSYNGQQKTRLSERAKTYYSKEECDLLLETVEEEMTKSSASNRRLYFDDEMKAFLMDIKRRHRRPWATVIPE